ncbi:hypothetical protein ACVRXQ_06550 [Streptococcus panodentis]|uniref:Uncharacterized protein n=1 Tax=Streptococcus panodentis TaxID=1581472 RepID=A0ABS5AV84_9STRE|nr:hypothetical protein [Streptococcus panodentis]MBP2620485.1 hypothetical protein [Streptococcus panodentis]
MKQTDDGKKYLVVHGEKLIEEIAQTFPVTVQEYDGTKVGLIKLEDLDQIPEELQALLDDSIEIL